jgi:hypothetical protein
VSALALSRGRTIACAVTAGAFVLLALASVVRTAERSAIGWHGERIRWEHTTPFAQGLIAETYATPVDPRLFVAWRAALKPGDTYAFAFGIPDGNRTVGRAVEMYARFYLLPYVQVARPRDADVVFAIKRDPRTLGLRDGGFWKIAKDVYAMRVARG